VSKDFPSAPLYLLMPNVRRSLHAPRLTGPPDEAAGTATGQEGQRQMSGTTASGETVVRRSGQGWVVGDQEASDLTSAMVLADLLAADLASSGAAPAGGTGSGAALADGLGKAADTSRGAAATGPSAVTVPKPAARHAGPVTGPATRAGEADEAARLAVTVAQLEHALTARIRVEQAIGVLAERHRLRTRDAFELLRSAARTRGRRVIDIAEDVVNSTSNALLRLPEELERKPEPHARIRSARRARPIH